MRVGSPMSVPDPAQVDILLIGAGPVGLYGAYYAGFRGLSVGVLDALPRVCGQELIDALHRQAAPFQPRFFLGQQAQCLIHKRVIHASRQWSPSHVRRADRSSRPEGIDTAPGSHGRRYE
jgi:thioredoxin reductase